jgi:hypothetical protein
LLAGLRAEIQRVTVTIFRGDPPPLFKTLATDLLAIGAGYVHHHDLEAARGWDPLQLLRGLKPLVAEQASRVKQMATETTR